MQPTNATPAPRKPITNGQIFLGIVAFLFVLAMIFQAMGVKTTTNGYCDSTKRDILNGNASTAAAERYYRECD